MKHLIKLMILGLALLAITACSGGPSAENGSAAQPESSQDIAFEAQVVPATTPTQTDTTLPTEIGTDETDEAPATDLPTEIIEQTSPVSPASNSMTSTISISDTDSLPPGSAPLVALAIEDLGERSGLSPDEITVASVESREWSDASLGCPQEGMMYAQVITPGYLIVLEAAGQTYNYHTNATDNVVLCER